jgi:hypothetical protein
MEKEKMQQLEDDIREIKTALIGNPAMNQKGLVNMVKENSDYIAKDKGFKQKALGLVVGIQFAVGAAWTYITHKG